MVKRVVFSSKSDISDRETNTISDDDKDSLETAVTEKRAAEFNL